MNSSPLTVLKTVWRPAERIQSHVDLKMLVLSFYFLHACQNRDAVRCYRSTVHSKSFLLSIFGLGFQLNISEHSNIKVLENEICMDLTFFAVAL